MGRASRWLRNLLSPKKPSQQPTQPSNSTPTHHKWGFIHSFREKPNQTPPPLANDRKGSSYRELVPLSVIIDEEEQNRPAIAVAAATAAVAEAAVAAANAAAAVVRLTSCTRSPVSYVGVGRRVELAAVKIQAVFRGYLARRALRALKGLVKLQALVRGYIVRKQAAETLRCMQALVRVQARARSCRTLQSERSMSERRPHLHAGPPTPEKNDQTVQGIDWNSDMSGLLKRNPSKPAGIDAVAGWNWLDKWMEEKYWDSREAIRTEGMAASVDDEKSDKILEVDPGKPQFIHMKRNNHHHSSCSTVNSDQNSLSFATMPEPPSKDFAAVQQSVPSPSSVEMQQCKTPLSFNVDTGDHVESPQFYSASSRHGSSRKGPFTPSKSECSRSLFSGYSGHPNYMAKTESYRAKVRSQSAPKQRPEYEKSNSMKRASSHGMMQNSSVAMSHKSSSLHTRFANKAYPGSGRLDRLGMPIRM